MTCKPKTLHKIALIARYGLFFLVLCGCAARPAISQTQVSATPQNVNQIVFAAQVAAGVTPVFTQNCVPTAGHPCGIQNIGQTVHILTYTTTSPAFLDIRIEGSIDGSTFFPISDDATNGSSGVSIATGSYAAIRVNLVSYVGSGSLTAYYNGTSATPAQLFGAYSDAQRWQKIVFRAISSDSANLSVPIVTPFGSSGGTLFVVGLGNLSATAEFQIGTTVANANTITNAVYFLNSATTIYALSIPPEAASTVSVSYTPGTAATTTFSAYYLFNPPGAAPTVNYTHIASTTATVVKPGSGVLRNVTIGTAAVGTTTVFDLAPAACTATPATNVVSVITSATQGQSYSFGVILNNGICVKSSSASIDVTVGYQ